MRRVEGKVAFVTGAARGQGRAHCVKLASEGADVIAVDICADVDTVPYPGATPEDLEQTVRLVEETGGGKIAASQVDVRDLKALQAAVSAGVDRFGRLDIVVANAGISTFNEMIDLDEAQWQTMIDVNLTGVWKTIRAAVPAVIDAGNGGSVVLISSTAGLKAFRAIGHYVASKHGVLGLMRTLAIELAAHDIRVNSIHPANVETDMITNRYCYQLFRPDLEAPTAADAYPAYLGLNLLQEPWAQPADISEALMFLVSDEARYMTGFHYQSISGS